MNQTQEDLYSPSFQKQVFDDLAGSYDKINQISSFGLASRMRRKLLSGLIGSNKHIHILDILCGAGETWKLLRGKFPKAEIHGMDISRKMMDQSPSALYSVQLMETNILENSLPSGQYDLITCCFGLKHFNAEQLKIVFEESFRLLTEDGEIVFLELVTPRHLIGKKIFKFISKHVLITCSKVLHRGIHTFDKFNLFIENAEGPDAILTASDQAGFSMEIKEFYKGSILRFYGRKRAKG